MTIGLFGRKKEQTYEMEFDAAFFCHHKDIIMEIHLIFADQESKAYSKVVPQNSTKFEAVKSRENFLICEPNR